jgi:hypothetical protein
MDGSITAAGVTQFACGNMSGLCCSKAGFMPSLPIHEFLGNLDCSAAPFIGQQVPRTSAAAHGE